MKTGKALLIAACVTLIAGIGQASAQSAGRSAKGGDRVCAEDAKKFCSKVRPGGGRVYQCMTGHENELAPACRERLTAAKARYDEFANACKSDAEKYCKGIRAGAGRILSCLKGRESDLTAECKAQFGRTQRDATVTR
ncbi:MAG TPA: cysteine rich repeat-containing protein [Burkholderiales bacterium]|jgi:hypothetical protein|nr:cysteine rich repeat-containing protein [Burkholderiales bacterium]